MLTSTEEGLYSVIKVRAVEKLGLPSGAKIIRRVQDKGEKTRESIH